MTGKTGDGGIDGHGVLAVNDFVTFRVCFNASASWVGWISACARLSRRDDGSGGQGMILTTGTFTVDAQRSRRDGAPPWN